MSPRSLKISGTGFREKAIPSTRDGEVIGVLVTGIRPVSVRESLDLLALTLAIAVPFTGGVLAIAAFVIARRALRPVHNITATAKRIARGDLHPRGCLQSPPMTRLASWRRPSTSSSIAKLEDNFVRERRFTTGDVSHQLRTPLTAMETALEVTLSKARSAEEYREVLRSCRAARPTWYSLQASAAPLPASTRRAQPASFKPVSVLQLLDSVVDTFQDAHKTASVSLLASEPDALIAADPELLSRPSPTCSRMPPAPRWRGGERYGRLVAEG